MTTKEAEELVEYAQGKLLLLEEPEGLSCGEIQSVELSGGVLKIMWTNVHLCPRLSNEWALSEREIFDVGFNIEATEAHIDEDGTRYAVQCQGGGMRFNFLPAGHKRLRNTPCACS